jgi:thiosulfate/3-mercaptopyruvate sulfurtransferase
MTEYARPEMLVSTEWLVQHLRDPDLRIVEVDVDTSAYDQGHIPGAVGWNWQTQLCDPVRLR